MDPEQKPRILANKIILQLIHHGVSDKVVPSWEDFASIRVVFRQCGGSWSAILEGDHKQLELLRNIIIAWAHMPIRKHQLERLI